LLQIMRKNADGMEKKKNDDDDDDDPVVAR
jgi:hypothetical protein